MKHVVFSEKLNKYFDSEEACVDAENAEEARVAKRANSKKEAAKLVEEASLKVSEAYQDYATVKQQANDMYKETREKVSKMLLEAQTKLRKAQNERCDAIRSFNKEYGTYTVSYSGDKAYNEYSKFNQQLEDIFNFFLF